MPVPTSRLLDRCEVLGRFQCCLFQLPPTHPHTGLQIPPVVCVPAYLCFHSPALQSQPLSQLVTLTIAKRERYAEARAVGMAEKLKKLTHNRLCERWACWWWRLRVVDRHSQLPNRWGLSLGVCARVSGVDRTHACDNSARGFDR